MTIKELVEILQAQPDHSRLVVMAKDAEGNSHSPIEGAEESWYIPVTTWSGDCPHTDDVASGEVELPDNAVKVLVVWPVN